MFCVSLLCKISAVLIPRSVRLAYFIFIFFPSVYRGRDIAANW